MAEKRRKKSKWRPEFVVKIYELCRDGLKLQQVANAIGVTLSTLKDWRISDEAVDYAIERGQDMGQKGTATTFIEHAFERLPPDLQETWSSLLAIREEPNPRRGRKCS